MRYRKMLWLLPVFCAILYLEIGSRADSYHIFYASDGVRGFLVYLSSDDTIVYPVLLLLPAYMITRAYFRPAVAVRKKDRKRLVWEQARRLAGLAGLFALLYAAVAYMEVWARLWQPVGTGIWLLFFIFSFLKQLFFMRLFLLCRWIGRRYVPGVLLVTASGVFASRTDIPVFLFGPVGRTLLYCLGFFAADVLLVTLTRMVGERCDLIETE